MDEKTMSIYKIGKFLSVILVMVWLGLFIGCFSATGETFPSKQSLADLSKSQNSQLSPRLVVEEFMEQVSKGNIEEADKYTTPNDYKPSNSEKLNPSNYQSLNQGQGSPSKFNWAENFYERGFQLENVLDEIIEENMATVKTRIRAGKLSEVYLDFNFYLKKVGDRWAIYDLNLVDK